MCVNKNDLLLFTKDISPEIQAIFMDPKETVFEENPKMNCFYCEKYGKNWHCPPYLPNIDYPKMFAEFDCGLFICLVCSVQQPEMYKHIRAESSRKVHNVLLRLEKWLWNHDCPNALSFTAGSCKLCKDGCGEKRCSNPKLARSPLEATGVNVVKTARKYGIKIKFPADEQIMRLGLIMWQEPD